MIIDTFSVSVCTCEECELVGPVMPRDEATDLVG